MENGDETATPPVDGSAANTPPSVPVTPTPVPARPTHWFLFWIPLLAEFGLGGLGAVLAWLWSVDMNLSVADFSKAWVWAMGVLATVPMIALAVAMDYSHWQPLVKFRRDILRPILTITRKCNAWELLLLSLAAGIGEEIFCRGFLQNAISGLVNPAVGLLVASVVFGVLHAMSPLYVAWAALIGAYLGALLLWTGTLWVPIIAHALYDLIILLSYKYHRLLKRRGW